MEELPLSPEKQRAISSKELARLIMDLLQRNEAIPANERAWRISYYPFQLSSLRGFEIIGYSQPEVPQFARKWSEAVALLEANAFIAQDPSQSSGDFMFPTSFATPEKLTEVLGERQLQNA